MHIFYLKRKTYPTDGIKTVEHVEQNPIDCLQDIFEMSGVFIYPQPVGWDSGVPLSLSKLEYILQPTGFKMSLMPNLGL